MSNKILVIEDDPNICELLKLYLAKEGYQITFAHDGSTGIDKVHQLPDLVILDIMLPIIHGLDVCRLIRMNYNIPVIMLTAKDSSQSKVDGLDAGADDYVVKPFDPLELCARIRALLRRSNTKKDTVINKGLTIGKLHLDMDKYQVFLDEELVNLKPKEVALLYFFATNPNITFSRDTLLEKVWGYDYTGETRTVDVHVKRLREKIETEDSPYQIRTIWGVGYCFEVKKHG